MAKIQTDLPGESERKPNSPNYQHGWYVYSTGGNGRTVYGKVVKTDLNGDIVLDNHMRIAPKDVTAYKTGPLDQWRDPHTGAEKK